ncbi:hypothetical protein NM208_g14901 [Fusarium decemcellulare]|uniref:Uncharacterized protein n=1 Tax=Fusarium decemcellulare TaxID=57161 RepID=A0ACC1REN9_9HYPO|nr:hypothetical protein NM208_g14901 [Fusarium decemcellulare]
MKYRNPFNSGLHYDPQHQSMLDRDLNNLLNYGDCPELSIIQAYLNQPDPPSNVSEASPTETLEFPAPVKNSEVMSPPPMRTPVYDGLDDEWLNLDEPVVPKLAKPATSHQSFSPRTMTPGPETLEVVTPKPEPQLTVSLPMIQEIKQDEEKPPRKHRLQVPPVTGTVDPNDLPTLLNIHTFQYQGHITSQTDAVFLRARYDALSRQTLHTSEPGNDGTFPITPWNYRARIQEMFEAVCDWSSRQVTKHRRQLGLGADLSKVCDDEIVPPVDRMPPLAEQWKNVIHRVMSDVEIELLCAQILFNKVLIHSALRAPWISRITNSPYSETRRKYQNKAGNDRKRTLIEQGGSERKKAKRELV